MSSPIWQFLDWKCHTNIKACFTFKNDQHPQSFNLAKHAFADDEKNRIQEVQNNRLTLIDDLNLVNPIIWLTQTHSNRCIQASVDQIGQEADASYCDNNQQVCAVLTADCLPIFLADGSGKEIAVVHGGWRGLLNGVIENALEQFDSDNIQAYLGPAIGANAFEVGFEVKQQFLERSKDFENAFAKEHKPGKTMANIYQIARIILEKKAVTDIQGGQYCTVNDSTLFSYRQGDITGRMAHLIWLVD